jgi:quinol monooxygenase YgiN
MPIIRLIHVHVEAAHKADAERIWKESCAPLMIKQKGCLSEELMKCLDATGEYISYSEWEDQSAIDTYLESPAHQEIRQHTRGLKGPTIPVVKRYTLV